MKTHITIAIMLALTIAGPMSAAGDGTDASSENRPCRDGVDNDGDGAIDLADPGCSSKKDTSELGTTVCDDGLDNDSDGDTDTADDAGCSGPSDATEVREYDDFQALPESLAGLDIQAISGTTLTHAIRAHGDYVYLSTPNQVAVLIFDVSDPWNPVAAGQVDVGPGTGGYEGLELLPYGDRVVLAVPMRPKTGNTGSVDNLRTFSSGPVGFYDVTDPSTPMELARFNVTSHSVAAHPETRIVYTTRSLRTDAPGLEIIDASDPDAISHVKTWDFPLVAQDGTVGPFGDPQNRCNFLSLDARHDRLYCGAGLHGLVLDIADPVNPVLLTAIRQADSSGVHCCDLGWALPLLDGSVVAWTTPKGDCVPTPPGTTWQTGTLWFYDLATSPPSLLSVLSIPVPAAAATSGCVYGPGVGSELGLGSGMLAYGWEDAGVVLLDATDPAHPSVLSQDASNGGDSRGALHHRGLVFASGKASLAVAVPQEGVPNPMAPDCPNDAIASLVCKP